MKIILLILTSITTSYCQIFSVDSIINLTGTTTRLTTGSIRYYPEKIQQSDFINYGIVINSSFIYKYDSTDWVMYTRSVITLDAFDYIVKHFNCDSTKMKCTEVKVDNKKYKFKDFRHIVWPEYYKTRCIPTKE